MNSAAIAKNKEPVSNVIEIADQTEKKSKKKSDDKRSLIIMTLISLLVMSIAVSSIYFVIKSNPELVHQNDQTTQVAENDGFVNPNSIQQLEHDTSNITLKPAESSNVFIVTSVVLMAVMAGSFLFIKVKERKEDD